MPYNYNAEKQIVNIRSQFIYLRDTLDKYDGKLPLFNARRIKKEDLNPIISMLDDLSVDPEIHAMPLQELLISINRNLTNDINHYSNDYAKGKLDKKDKELYELMRSVRNEIRDPLGIVNKLKAAHNTIESLYNDYKDGTVNDKADRLFSEIGLNGVKPSIESCENLSIVGNTPESILPNLMYLAHHDYMMTVTGYRNDAKKERSYYTTTYNRLLDELQFASPDVQAKYAVQIATYEYKLRAEAKNHYDEYLQNAPKDQNPEEYAKKKLSEDPVYWACASTHYMVSCFESTKMSDVYKSLASWQSHYPSMLNRSEYAFIGNILLNEDIVSEIEVDFAKKELAKSGFVTSSPEGRIAYAYGEFLKDNGKNGALFNSMKYYFNDFAKLNHEDIGELSRKNYYSKLTLAEKAASRYVASFEGKTPKGKDLENYNLAKAVKDMLAEQRANISKSAPLPKEVVNEQLPTREDIFKSFSDMLAEAEKVDPMLLISSKEFKAIKNTLKDLNKIAKSVDPKAPHKLDRLEAFKECCQLLDLQAEAYIELKEDPFRSPKQAHLKEGSTAKERYDFVKKMQSTIKLATKSIVAEEKKLLEELSTGKGVENGDKAPITLSEYNESIKPLLNEQLQDLKDIYSHRWEKSEVQKKNEEMLRDKYDLSKDAQGMHNVYTIIDLRKDGLMYAMNDINCAINASGSNGPEANLNILIKKPNVLALFKLLSAEVLESKLLENPKALDSMDPEKYTKVLESVNSFVRKTYEDESGVMKPMSADTLLKDFCTSAGIRERVAAYENYCKENKIADPLKQNPEPQAMHI